MEDIYNVRKGLAEIINNMPEDEEDNEPDVNMQLVANDITGSLGVWGIKQV